MQTMSKPVLDPVILPHHEMPELLSQEGVMVDSSRLLRAGIDFTADVGVVVVAVQMQYDSNVEWTPLAVTNHRETIIVKNATISAGGKEFTYPSSPWAAPSLARWRYRDIERYCGGERVQPAELYEKIVGVHKKYVAYHADGIAELMALWCIGTYLFRIYSAYPYIDLNGPSGSGKSKQLQLTSRLGFNGREVVNPTEATVFRLIHHTGATLCIDEGEYFHGQVSPLIRLLNVGYAAGGTVPRCDKDGGIQEYDTYSPKMFASIRGITAATGTRCIRINLLRSADAQVGNRNITETSEDWAGIRHGLYTLAMDEFSAIRDIYRSDAVRIFENRDNEKWAPIFSLAMFFQQRGCEGLVDRIKEVARESVLQTEEKGLEPLDEAVLMSLHWFNHVEDAIEVSPSDVFDHIRKTAIDALLRRKTVQDVGYALRRLGFRRLPSRRRGSTYAVTRAQILDVAGRYGAVLETEPTPWQ